MIQTNDNYIGCNKCIKDCPTLSANIAKEKQSDEIQCQVETL